MKLEQKKELIARTLGIGRARIMLNKERLLEVKEAITREDIRALVKDKAIIIKEIKGRKSHKTRKTRRRAGSKKKNPRKGKKIYVKLTRKLRAYASSLKKLGQINREKYRNIRKEIRARAFRSKAHLKERLAQ